MHIVVKDTVPLGFAVNSVAHGVLMAHLKWSKDPDYECWLKSSFKKVTCIVPEKEFDSLKECGEHLIVTESALSGVETAIVFCPKEKPHKRLSFLKLLK